MGRLTRAQPKATRARRHEKRRRDGAPFQNDAQVLHEQLKAGLFNSVIDTRKMFCGIVT